MIVPRETPSPRRSRVRSVITCSCGVTTDRGRAGLCPRCAVRKTRGHEIGDRCAACGDSRRAVLRWHRLADGPVTLCANDSAIAGRRPLSLDALRAELGTGLAQAG